MADSENKKIGAQGFEMEIVDRTGGPIKLWVCSILSGRTAEPIVEIQLGEEVGQLSAEAIDQFVLHVLQASTASLNDAFMYEFFTNNGVKPTAVVEMLRELREYRNKRYEDFLAGVQTELRKPQ